jgi:hypothetical protein
MALYARRQNSATISYLFNGDKPCFMWDTNCIQILCFWAVYIVLFVFKTIGTLQRIYLSSNDFCSDSTPVLCIIRVEFLNVSCFASTPVLCIIRMEFLNVSCFPLTLADGLRCAWYVYPILCRCRCPEIRTSSIDWDQWNRFHLKTETECSLRNVVFLNTNRTMDNV